jgi:hypothetical protein
MRHRLTISLATALAASVCAETPVHFPSPSPAHPGEDVPMARFRPANNKPYAPTPEEKRQITAKTEQLGAMIRVLRERHADEDLLADVEIYHSAARWIMEFPDEFFNQAAVGSTLAVLEEGVQRAGEMQSGKTPWTTAKGRVSRGYRSAVDGSVQPYRVIVPESYDGSRPYPLCVYLHGRAVTTYEVNFLRATVRPVAASAEPPDRNWIQLDIYGRGNNTYQWPGETDVFEAMESVKSRYKIDGERILLKGFSMGGAGVWHIGLHYPSVWAAIEAGAGDTRSQRYAVQDQLAPHQQAMTRIFDYMFAWALNATNAPFVAYVGEIDNGFDKHIAVREQLVREGIHFQGELYRGYTGVEVPTIRFLVAAGTPHRTPPEYRKMLDEFDREGVARGRKSPERVRFVTYTTRYNTAHWVTVDGLGRHYERADVDAKRNEGRTQFEIATHNVMRLILRETEHVEGLRIDGQELRVKAAAEVALTKWNGRWEEATGETELRKRHGLQGPIDDAFLGPFLIVRPTGIPWNAAANAHAMRMLEVFERRYRLAYRGHPRVKVDRNVSEEDLKKYNLVLFGDPGSNHWIGRLNGKLPLEWTKESVAFGAHRFAAAESVPAMIYPNPLSPDKYVVVNSGLTADWWDWAGDHPTAQLGDFAVLKVKDNAESPAVQFAGVFDEEWKLPAR